MNSCLSGNSGLWILIIALLLGANGTNLLNSKALTGCGWPFLVALTYCLYKNGTLSRLLNSISNGGCGCNG